MPGRLASFGGRRYGAARLVTHDDEQRRMQVFGRVLDARKDGIVGDVARDADGKQVTET
jgi:hypothetical protein